MTAARWFAAVLLAAAVGVAAEPPKLKPLPKPTPAQVADAEAKLTAAKCSLHHEEKTPPDILESKLAAKFALDRVLFPRQPGGKPGPVDVLAFPDDTSDADLAKLLPLARKLPGLKTVDLGRTTKLTGTGIKAVAAHLPDLEGLFLDGSSVADGDLAALAGLPNLVWLDLSNTAVGDAGMRALAAFPRLRVLVLNGNANLTADGLAALKGAAPLRELHVGIDRDPVAMAKAISGLDQLAELRVWPVGDDEAAALGKMDGLASLDTVRGELGRFRSIPFVRRAAGAAFPGVLTDVGLKSLTGCIALESLRLTGAGVTGALPELAKLDRLTDLSLPNTGVTDAGAAAIATLKPLRRLDLGYTRVTDAGVRDLADLPRLERLVLSGSRVGDEGLRTLTRFRVLQELELDDTRVSAAEMPELGDFGGLKYLSLTRTNVTPASLKYLGWVRSLAYLDLRDNCPNLAEKDLPPLRQALPKCRAAADPGCELLGVGMWPGAVGYAFRIPEDRSRPERPQPEPKSLAVRPTPPVKVVPPPPPPKVAPAIRPPVSTGSSRP